MHHPLCTGMRWGGHVCPMHLCDSWAAGEAMLATERHGELGLCLAADKGVPGYGV